MAVGAVSAALSDTEQRTNTFTFGKVDITLDEAGWNLDNETNTYKSANSSNVRPGQSIDKAPKITLASDSQDAYLFVKVTIPTGDYKAGGDDPTGDDGEIFTIADPNAGWVEITSSATHGDYEHIYVYGTAANAKPTKVSATDTAPLAVFNDVTYRADAIKTLVGNKDIEVKAYGIQADDLSASDMKAVLGGATERSAESAADIWAYVSKLSESAA